MTPLAHLALLGFPLLALALFSFLRPRRAVLAGYVLGFLLLPEARYTFAGLPDYNKFVAITVPVLLGVALFDHARLARLRLQWFDVPILAWCIVPVLSSLANGLGLYDGMSSALTQTVGWGLPYLMGRLYLTDARALREAGVAVVLGGLLYVPLCLFELRMSPQLHNTLYGFHQHSFAQHTRGDGYRPMVFLQHALAVSMWMALASLVAFALWHTGAQRKLLGVPMLAVAGVLAVVTYLSQSTGPMLLLLLAVGVCFALPSPLGRMTLAALILAVPVYIFTRALGLATGDWLLAMLEPIAHPDRIASLAQRLDAENALLGRAMERPWLGWAGWGRYRVDAEGQEVQLLDSMWIITLGRYGIIGIAAYVSLLLLPTVLLWRRARAGFARLVGAGPAVALTLASTFYLIDKMVNAMPNLVILMIAGGLTGYLAAVQNVQRAATRRRARAPAHSGGLPRPVAPSR
ncbi:MAG: hypothetical protein WD009_01905 [Phycisphaeraceae bacterium]